LFKPQTIAPREMYPTTELVKPHWMTYGLGWFQQDYRGRAVDFHTGSIDGMVAIHGLIRDERLGVYSLANLDHAELRHAIMYTVFDRYSGESKGAGRRDWNAEFLKLYGNLHKTAEENRRRQESQRVAGTSPSLALEKYAGTYSDPLHGPVEITFTEGQLHIRYGSRMIGALEHWNYETFRAKWNAEWISPSLATFNLDAQGRPVALQFLGSRYLRQTTN
jgi:hypothetical protein